MFVFFKFLAGVMTLVGLGPAPGYWHICSVSVSLAGNGKQVYPRCTHDWMGYKSSDQMAVGRALDWLLDLDRDWIWDTRWFWIVVGFGLSSSFVYITS